MTTSLRRLCSLRSWPGLTIGLAVGLLLTPAWAEAAPPDDTTDDAADDTTGDAAGDSEDAPADSEDAPADSEDAPADAPADSEDTGASEGPTAEAPADEVPSPTAEAPLPADPPPASKPSNNLGDKHRVTYTSLLAPRINPLGLEERLWIGYEYRLYDKDKTILNGSNLAIYFRPILNPAIALVGATVQIQPAAVLRFRATYSFVQWFGTFQYFQSYKSPYDDYSETRLDGQADFDQSNYTTNGHQVELEALLQARYKGLVIRSTLFGIYNHYNPRGDDDVFYAVRWEVMAPARGWMLANDTDLLWLQSMKGPRNATLLAGARATTLMPLFPKGVYEEGDVVDNPVGPQFRVGPAIGYIFYDKPERKFNKPTLLMMPQWNVKHRWRTGRDVKTAFPTIVIAFVFSGQLWGKGK